MSVLGSTDYHQTALMSKSLDQSSAAVFCAIAQKGHKTELTSSLLLGPNDFYETNINISVLGPDDDKEMQ